jgi:fructose-bisphosphate aldolase class II
MSQPGNGELMQRAWEAGTAIPAFNIPYLPMVEPVVRALRETGSFGFVVVARLEWVKFESKSPEAVADEYERQKDERHTRLHLDHVPVIDEDGLRVDYMDDIGRALRVGYGSVMIDGSRLPLEENIQATARVVQAAHAAGVPVEAELGAVLGHEEGPLPPYEELFQSGRGFTDPGEAQKFVSESGCDWLSVAIGNIHGAISETKKHKKKPAARLDIDHLDRINDAVSVPLVLHGGTGIPHEYIREAMQHGIAKINIATAIRQPYEAMRDRGREAATDAVYEATRRVIEQNLELAGTADVLGTA